MPYEVPAHIWHLILPHLGQPAIPSSLSHPNRSELRRPDLAKASRVCKLFSALCQPLLYGPVLVTDDLPSLLRGILNPATHARFKHVQHLRIEFSPKGDHGGYEMIMVEGGKRWDAIGLQTEELGSLISDQCQVELRALHTAVAELDMANPRKIFTKIETVSIASIYGSETDDWNRLRLKRIKKRPMVGDTQDQFHGCLSQIPTMRHYCVRNTLFPLSMSAITAPVRDDPASGRSTIYHTTVHFDEHSLRLPLPLGQSVRWTSDVGPSGDSKACARNAAERIQDFMQVRERMGNMNGMAKGKADVDMFCASGLADPPIWASEDGSIELEGPEAELAGTAELGRGIQRELRKQSRVKDNFNWRPTSMMPICEACGSGVPL